MTKKEKTPVPAVVPRAATSRISHYLRYLEELRRRGETTISSKQLGDALGVTAAQVRKDLGHFGQFGFPGIGYKISHLIPEMRGILGTDRFWKVALVGVGSLGTALLHYKGFASHGFRVVAAFDSHPAVVGQQVGALLVEPISRLEEVVSAENIELGLICVPSNAAQEVADRLVQAGVKGVFNFAPRLLEIADEVPYVSMDLAVELEQLAFLVSRRESPPAGTS